MLGLVLGLTSAGCAADRAGEGTAVGTAATAGPPIYMDITMTTWRKRAQAAIPLEPILRVKLRNFGFAVVRAPAEPHELVLRVDYRETRGREIRFDEYLTDIACDVRLEHLQRGLLAHWTIQPPPSPPDAPPPSYLDTWLEFQSEPYFFFLGRLTRGTVTEPRPDTVEILAQGVEQITIDKSRYSGERTTSTWAAHGTAPEEAPLARNAAQKAIRELVRLRDARALPVLTSLVSKRDPMLRLAAVVALGDLRAMESRPLLQIAAQEDQDAEVRRAAAHALEQLAAVPPPP
jgi:hypothetical protein